jgi:hypothetical protein
VVAAAEGGALSQWSGTMARMRSLLLTTRQATTLRRERNRRTSRMVGARITRSPMIMTTNVRFPTAKTSRALQSDVIV